MRDRRPMNPALRRYLDELAAAQPPRPPGHRARAGARRGRAGMEAAARSRAAIPGLPNDVTATDIEIGPGLGARLYRAPAAVGAPPLMVYLHGGGWVVGSLATHDPFCRLLCAACGVAILSVDYRLAPEHPLPAALDDAAVALRWVQQKAAAHAIDTSRLALGGDSAGANIAAVTAHRAAAQGTPSLRALMLLYPVTDHPQAGHASYVENATGNGLEAGLMRWFWSQYAPGVAPDDPAASPLHDPAVDALPPTLVATAEYDPLRDEGIAYARHLERAGVQVTHLHAPDMHHNFPVHPGTVARFPQCDQALDAIAAWLRATLG